LRTVRQEQTTHAPTPQPILCSRDTLQGTSYCAHIFAMALSIGMGPHAHTMSAPVFFRVLSSGPVTMPL